MFSMANEERTTQFSFGSENRSIRRSIIVVLLFVAVERFTFYILLTEINGTIGQLLSNNFTNDVRSNNSECSLKTACWIHHHLDEFSDYLTISAFSDDRLFYAASYILTFLGGLLADGLFGVYSCLRMGAILQFIGFTLLMTSSLICSGDLAISGMIFLIFGTGLLKGNSVVFLVQQLQRYSERIFYYHYWFLQVGETVGIATFYLYLEDLYQAYIISVGFAFFMMLIIIVTGDLFRKEQPDTARILSTCSSFVCGEEGEEELLVEQQQQEEYRGSKLRWMLPFWWTVTIFMICHFQTRFTYTIQADRALYQHNGSDTSTKFLNVCSGISALLFIPLLAKMSTRCHLTVLRRMITGMVVFSLSLLCAVCAELIVKPDEAVLSSAEVVLLLLPQYILAGVSESLTLLAGHQLSWEMSPRGLQSTVMGVYIMTWGVAGFLDMGMTEMVRFRTDERWIPRSVDSHWGHLEYFFAVLICILVFNVVAFSIFVCRYSPEETSISASASASASTNTDIPDVAENSQQDVR